MGSILCPVCGELRDKEGSGETIYERGVCQECLLALYHGVPLVTEDNIIYPRDIAAYLVEFYAKRYENDTRDYYGYITTVK